MLTQVRRDLVTALSVLEISVYDVVPERFSPPGILVRPSTSGSYATAGQFPGELLVTLDLWVVVRDSDMSTEQEELDAIVESVLALDLDWRLQGIDGTRISSFHAGDFPVVIMHYAKQERL